MTTIFRSLGLHANRPATPAPARRRRRDLSAKPRAEGLERREVMTALGIDPSFGLGGTAFVSNPTDTATVRYSTYLANVALQADGKSVSVGYRSTRSDAQNITDILVERRNADGSPDPTFGAGGTAVISLKSGDAALDATGSAVAVQPDGKIVVLANAYTRSTPGTVPTSGYISDFAVLRLTPGGALDPSFNGTGYRLVDFSPAGSTFNVSDEATSLALAPGGKVVVAGNTYTNPATGSGSYDMAVARLNADGTLDGSFDGDGKQVVAFDRGGASSSKRDVANAVLVQADGKIILVGSAAVDDVLVGTEAESSTDIAVARLTDAGALDGTFGTGGKVVIAYDLGGDKRDSGNAAVLDGDKIVIAGTATVQTPTGSSMSFANSRTNFTLTRLTASGAPDPSFAGTGKYSRPITAAGREFQADGSAVAVLSDASYLVGGSASESSGNYNSAAYFAKVLPGGTPDGSYGVGGVALLPQSSMYGSMVVQRDGKILFTSSGGLSRTTAPDPKVLSASYVVPANAKKGKGKLKTVVVKFNTGLNASLAGNKATYQVRRGVRGKRFLDIQKVSYNADTFETTITLKKPAPKGVVQVVMASTGIADNGSQVLNDGASTAITVDRPTTAARARV